MSFKYNAMVFVLACLSSESMAGGVMIGLKEKYAENVLECAVDNPVNAEDLLKVTRDHQMPESGNAKCMLACVMKKTGMTDDEGKLSVEGLRKLASLMTADKPDVTKKTEDFINACLYVNDEEISGDKKHCERAALIFMCGVKHHGDIEWKPSERRLGI